jgi:hypothetical protein
VLCRATGANSDESFEWFGSITLESLGIAFFQLLADDFPVPVGYWRSPTSHVLCRAMLVKCDQYLEVFGNITVESPSIAGTAILSASS